MTQKIAVFDFDWTIVKPKNDSIFPKNVDDWQWYNSVVKSTIEQYIEEEYRIIIWTNQSKSWKIDMIENVANQFSVKPDLVICMNKGVYKPNIKYFIREMDNIKYDKKKSFMVGDALGREGDHSDVDWQGSLNLDIDCYAPEDIFIEEERIVEIPTVDWIEVIIMCGYPGSGKTTIAKSLTNYHIVSGDELKTSKKMIKDAEQWIDKTSVIFDATNMTVEKRNVFVMFASSYDVPVRCIWIDITCQEAICRNDVRRSNGGKKVPNIAIYKLRKTFEEPTESEGFELIVI